MAWMKEPSNVPKEYIVELTGPRHLQCHDSFLSIEEQVIEEQVSQLPLSSPVMMHTEKHKIVIHVKEVIDHSPILTDIPSAYTTNYSSTLRKHEYPTWNGTVDGKGPPPSTVVSMNLEDHLRKQELDTQISKITSEFPTADLSGYKI